MRCSLPTYAAVAWYHQAIDRAGRSVDQHYADALAFAQTDYAAALMHGPALPAEERHRIAAKMAALTGIPAETIEAQDLRLGRQDFMLGLLAAKGLRTGQLDARATRAIADSNLRPPFDDPSMSLGAGSSQPIRALFQGRAGLHPAQPLSQPQSRHQFQMELGQGTMAAAIALCPSRPI